MQSAKTVSFTLRLLRCAYFHPPCGTTTVWQRWGLCLVVSGSLHGDERPVSFYSIHCSVLLIRGAEVFSCLYKWSSHRRAALQPLPSVVKHEERVYAVSQRLRLMFFLIYDSLRGNGNVTQGSRVWKMKEEIWRAVLVLYRVLFSVTSAFDFSYHYKKKIHGGCCGWGLRTLVRVIVRWGDPIWSAGPSAEILHLHQSAVTHFCLSYIHWTRDRSLWASAVALCRCSSAVYIVP